jgi:ribosomal protein S18 acetylase RimI-like enzyme
MQNVQVIESVVFEKWQALGFNVKRCQEGIALMSGIPDPTCNKFLFFENRAPSFALFEPFFEKKLPFSVFLPDMEEKNIRFCLQYGLKPFVTLMVMEQDLASWSPIASEIPIELVATDDAFYEHCTTVACNFPMNQKSYDVYNHRLLLLTQKKESPMLLFTGYLDGEAVVSGRLFLGTRYASIYHIGTVPNARRQGAAFAMMQVLLFEAKKRGFTHATLSATEMARPLYERLGFKNVQLYTIFAQ